MSKRTRRNRQQMKTAQVMNPAPWMVATAETERWTIPQDGGMYRRQAELYQRLSWVHIAISTVARAAATIAFSVKQMVGEKLKDIPNHAFEKLLQRPNPLQSRFEFLESVFSYRELTGNCYIWLNRFRADQAPSEMWILPTHRVRPVPDGRMFLRGYVFTNDHGVEIPLQPWEIVHLKSFHPLDSFVGLSPIEVLATVAIGDLAMQNWNTNFFGKDNAKPAGMLAFADSIDEPTWQKMDADLKAQHGGTKRSLMRLRGAGKGGVEWIATNISQKDMEFLLARTANKEEIFAIYAPGLASVLAVNATEANATAGESTMQTYALYPLLVSLAEKLTNDVLPAYGEGLVGSFDDPRRKDRTLELAEQAAFERSHTIDETRERYYETAAIGDARGDLLVAEINHGPTDGRSAEERTPPQLLQQPMMAPPEANEKEVPPTEPAVLEQPEPEAEPEQKAIIKASIKGHSGAMLALVLPLDVAERLAIPDGVPAAEMHVTLAYLGKVDTFDDDERRQLEAALEIIKGMGPLPGTISGLGRFNTDEGEGMQAVYASVDVPGLPEFRQRVMDLLCTAGIELPNVHGFTPHVTLAYVPADAPSPVATVPALDVTFDTLVLAWADDRRTVLLEDRAVMKAADLDRWERKAIKAIKAGKSAAVKFASDAIEEESAEILRQGLEECADVADVRDLFGSIKAQILTPVERALADKLIPIFEKFGQKTLRDIISGAPIAFDALDASLRAVLLPAILEYAMEQMAGFAEEIGPDFDPAAAMNTASEWAMRYTFDLVKDINASTLKVVRNAIATYTSTPGMTREALERLLRPAFGVVRAEMIAVTEVTRASAQAARQYQAFLADNGLDFERINNTNADDRVCSICGPLNGKPESEWPNNEGPPWHIRCRCFVTLRRRKTRA